MDRRHGVAADSFRDLFMPAIDARDLADLEAMANVGEVVGPVAHEFNNLLNTLLLQIAVLEQTCPEGLKEDMNGLKQHGRTAAALVRLVQQYRRQSSSEEPQCDLNEAVKAAVAGVHAGGLPPDVKVGFTPGGGLPPVRAGFPDLKRLASFLLGNATLSGCHEVIVRTETGVRGVSLVVNLTGASVDSAFLTRLTAPALSVREGTAGLELAAARSLTRRLGGELSAGSTDGGVRVAVDLPAG
jgi:signal transduction histidine kinase